MCWPNVRLQSRSSPGHYSLFISTVKNICNWQNCHPFQRLLPFKHKPFNPVTQMEYNERERVCANPIFNRLIHSLTIVYTHYNGKFKIYPSLKTLGEISCQQGLRPLSGEVRVLFSLKNHQGTNWWQVSVYWKWRTNLNRLAQGRTAEHLPTVTPQWHYNWLGGMSQDMFCMHGWKLYLKLWAGKPWVTPSREIQGQSLTKNSMY